MKIFVTGGTGFIGKSLIPMLLAHGHEVLALTRTSQTEGSKGLKYVVGDLSNLAYLDSIMREFRPDALVHLAWEGLPDYSIEMCRKNLEYGINIFSSAAMAGCSVVLSTGSCWEYASRSGAVSENGELNSSSIFPAVKNALRYIGHAISSENKQKFYWLRLFYVYGTGQRISSLIPHIIESIENNKVLRLKHPGNRNDFIHVEDVASAILGVLEKQPKRNVYNVGSGYCASVGDVVETVCRIKGKVADRERLTVSEESGSEKFWADVSLIQNDIEWKPHYDIESGIMATIKSFMETDLK